MNYLLDTNACIAVINRKTPSVRTRLQAAMGTGNKLFVSSVAAFELWYGVAKSSQPQANRLRLETFFDGPIAPLPFDDEDAYAAGEIRAALEAQGRSIGAYDLLIAGQALRRGFTLVTANVAEFSRVKGLVWQDWSRLP